jgi:hypothetical protein
MTTYASFNGATTDAYQYLACFNAQKLTIQCSNAAILLGFGVGGGGQPNWELNDEPYLPVVGSIVRHFDWLRFKSQTLGVPAQLILTPASG